MADIKDVNELCYFHSDTDEQNDSKSYSCGF